MRQIELQFRNPLRSVTLRRVSGNAELATDPNVGVAVDAQDSMTLTPTQPDAQPDPSMPDLTSKVEELLDKIVAAFRERERLREESMHELAHGSVQLAMRVVKCIVGRCSEESSDRLVRLVKDVLQQSRGTHFNTLKLNPADCDRLAPLAPQSLWGDVQLELVADDSILVGDCLLEGDRQTLSCSLEHQLEAIETRMMEDCSYDEA